MSRSGVPFPAAVMVAAATLCAASDPAAAGVTGQFGVAVFGGLNTYAMKDVNEEIVQFENDQLVGAASPMEEVDGGTGFGGGLRWRSMGGFRAALDYERLPASSEGSDAFSTVELDLPADVVTATAGWLFPAIGTRARFGLAGGIGYYRGSGSFRFTDRSDGSVTEDELKGNGIGFHAGGTADLRLTDQIHVEVLAGYRSARSTDLEMNGAALITTDGDDAVIDWSGFMSRVGIAVDLGFLGAQ